MTQSEGPGIETANTSPAKMRVGWVRMKLVHTIPVAQRKDTRPEVHTSPMI